MMQRLVLWAIEVYQRHLSPRKGFSCAYRCHTGHASCSQSPGLAVMPLEFRPRQTLQYSGLIHNR